MDFKFLNVKNMQNWPWSKIIIGLIIFYMVWQTYQGKSLFEMFGLGQPAADKDEAHEIVSSVTIKDATGTETQLNVSSDIKTMSKAINDHYIQSYSVGNVAVPLFGVGGTNNTRCALATRILNLPEADFQVLNKHYHVAYGSTIYEAFEAVYQDPCGYFGVSDYDKAHERLANLKLF